MTVLRKIFEILKTLFLWVCILFAVVYWFIYQVQHNTSPAIISLELEAYLKSKTVSHYNIVNKRMAVAVNYLRFAPKYFSSLFFASDDETTLVAADIEEQLENNVARVQSFAQLLKNNKAVSLGALSEKYFSTKNEIIKEFTGFVKSNNLINNIGLYDSKTELIAATGKLKNKKDPTRYDIKFDWSEAVDGS